MSDILEGQGLTQYLEPNMDQETKKEFENLTSAVKEGFDEVDKRFDEVDKRFEQVDKRFEQVDKRFDKMDKRFDQVDKRFGQLKHELLEAMDDKLADLKGDLIILMRKEDRKLVSLIDLLKKKKFITEDEVKSLLSLEPFPKFTA